MSNRKNMCYDSNTAQIMVVYQYLCEIGAVFQLSIAYCGSKKSIYIHVCVHGTCVVEHFVGDLCSRFKPLSTLHLSVLLSLTLTPSFSLSGAIDTHLTASEAPFLTKVVDVLLFFPCVRAGMFRHSASLNSSSSAGFFCFWKILLISPEAKQHFCLTK